MLIASGGQTYRVRELDPGDAGAQPGMGVGADRILAHHVVQYCQHAQREFMRPLGILGEENGTDKVLIYRIQIHVMSYFRNAGRAIYILLPMHHT
jgi:hypothetical protein